MFKPAAIKAVLLSGMLIVCPSVIAEVYRCTTKSGSVVLSNQESDKAKSNCVKMDLPKSDSHKTGQKPPAAASVATQPSKGPSAVASQPLVEAKPKERETVRKKIIRSEIEIETKRLELVRTKIEEVSKRNVPDARKQDELGELKRQESNHEKNIKQLNVELSR